MQDDCSTDSTCDIVREYARRDPRIHLFVNPENMGWNRNFMSAMQRATGDYIALCDQDDIWYEDNIEKKMAALGSASLVYCYRCFMYDFFYIRTLDTGFFKVNNSREICKVGIKSKLYSHLLHSIIKFVL